MAILSKVQYEPATYRVLPALGVLQARFPGVKAVLYVKGFASGIPADCPTVAKLFEEICRFVAGRDRSACLVVIDGDYYDPASFTQLVPLLHGRFVELRVAVLKAYRPAEGALSTLNAEGDGSRTFSCAAQAPDGRIPKFDVNTTAPKGYGDLERVHFVPVSESDVIRSAFAGADDSAIAIAVSEKTADKQNGGVWFSRALGAYNLDLLRKAFPGAEEAIFVLGGGVVAEGEVAHLTEIGYSGLLVVAYVKRATNDNRPLIDKATAAFGERLVLLE